MIILELETLNLTLHHTFKVGDLVRHRYRPEWGIGTIDNIPDNCDNGDPEIGHDFTGTDFEDLMDTETVQNYGVVYPRFNLYNFVGGDQACLWYTIQENLELVEIA